MTNHLLWVVLTVSFARGSQRPRRTAILRIIGATICAVILGVTLGQSLLYAGLPTGLPVAWVGALIALTGFTLMGFIMFSLSAARGHTDTFSRITSTLPLSRLTKWTLGLIPPAIVLTITVAFTLPVVLYLKAPYGPAFLLFGLAGGLGLTLLPRPSLSLRSAIFLGAILASVTLLQQSRQLFVYPLIALPCLGLAWPRPLMQIHQTPNRQLINLPAQALHSWWFILKLLRNRRSFIALAFSTVVSFAVAGAIAFRHLAALSGAGWLLLGAILTAAIACDIRGLTPRHKAPEVEALSGPHHFVRDQVRAALMVAALPPLPILAVLLGAKVEPTTVLLAYCATLQLAALMIGLLASSIFVPREGDLGAQFFASALATTSLLSLPKLLHLQDFTLPHLAATWLIVAAASYAVIHLIEDQRRKQYAV